MKRRTALASLAAVLLCGATPAPVPPVAWIPARGVERMAFDGAGTLYALVRTPNTDTSGTLRGNNQTARIDVYPAGARAAARSVAVGANAFDLMLDGSKHLYVIFAAGSLGDPGVTEFEAGSSRVVRSLSIANPDAFALDGDGRLYVASESTERGDAFTISIYRPGETSPSGTIEQRSAAGDVQSMATDDDRLYVAASGESLGHVYVYALDGNALLRNVTAGLHGPLALAASSQGTLYVADAGAGGAVRVYSNGGAGLARTIAVHPLRIAVDRSNDLAVAGAGGTIDVYASAAGSAVRSTGGAVNAIAFDGAGKLYVARADGIAVFDAGH